MILLGTLQVTNMTVQVNVRESCCAVEITLLCFLPPQSVNFFKKQR